jgi:hypothetical protein
MSNSVERKRLASHELRIAACVFARFCYDRTRTLLRVPVHGTTTFVSGLPPNRPRSVNCNDGPHSLRTAPARAFGGISFSLNGIGTSFYPPDLLWLYSAIEITHRSSVVHSRNR